MNRTPLAVRNPVVFVERGLGVYCDLQIDKMHLPMLLTAFVIPTAIISGLISYAMVAVEPEYASNVAIFAGVMLGVCVFAMMFFARTCLANALLMLTLGGGIITASLTGFIITGAIIAALTFLLAVMNTQTYSDWRWSHVPN